MDNFKQQFQLYWIMIWLRRSIISAFTFTLFLVAIPFIIQFGITHLLIKQGATEASIEDINLNLFTGTFELKKLDITTGDYSPSQLQHLQANINMLDLVSSQIVLHEIQIDGLNVDLQLLENGSFALNGLTLLNSESSPDEPNVSDESDERESSTFEFGINKLSIINSKINYQESGFSHKNSINSLNLTNIKSWDATSIANL
ncbi:MAG: AsmA family protein, partial [Gammaproteobacteria bacterium]|nr:AsmA family protein [Gammaproteobacteria bacterium]